MLCFLIIYEVLGAFWVLLDPSCAQLGALGRLLGSTCSLLGATWILLGASLCPVHPMWAPRWPSEDFCGFLKISVEFWGFLRISADFCGFLWNSAEFCGIMRNSAEFCGILPSPPLGAKGGPRGILFAKPTLVENPLRALLSTCCVLTLLWGACPELGARVRLNTLRIRVTHPSRASGTSLRQKPLRLKSIHEGWLMRESTLINACWGLRFRSQQTSLRMVLLP